MRSVLAILFVLRSLSAAQASQCSGILSDRTVQEIGNGMLEIEFSDAALPDRRESIQDVVKQFMVNTETSAKNIVPAARNYDWKQVMSDQIIACFPKLHDLALMIAKRERLQAKADAEQRRQRQAQEQEAAREQAQQDAIDMQPANLLARAYGNYIFVKRCFDARRGYLAIYISDQEMERARSEIKTVSDKIKAGSADIDDNAAWRRGNQIADSGEASRESCQTSLSLLDRVAKLADVEGSETKKDFE